MREKVEGGRELLGNIARLSNPRGTVTPEAPAVSLIMSSTDIFSHSWLHLRLCGCPQWTHTSTNHLRRAPARAEPHPHAPYFQNPCRMYEVCTHAHTQWQAPDARAPPRLPVSCHLALSGSAAPALSARHRGASPHPAATRLQNDSARRRMSRLLNPSKARISTWRGKAVG